MNELDKQLKQLMMAVQAHPPLSVSRQDALNKLVKAILKSGKLWQPEKDQFHKTIYDDALQDLFLYLCEYPEKYDPNLGSFISWLNVLLKQRFYNKAIAFALEKPLKKVSLTLALGSTNASKHLSIVEQIKRVIELDPEDLFKRRCLENNPRANFQFLVRLRLAPQTWQQISTAMQLKTSTLNSFYSRCLKDFKPKIKKYLLLDRGDE